MVVGHALYSVPFQIEAGTALRARRDRTTVKLYRDRVLVKTHPRQAEGGTHLDAADLPPEKAALALRDPSSLVAAAVSHGAHVGVYAERLVAGPLPWTRMRHLYRLLGLVERYGAEAVNDLPAPCAECGATHAQASHETPPVRARGVGVQVGGGPCPRVSCRRTCGRSLAS